MQNDKLGDDAQGNWDKLLKGLVRYSLSSCSIGFVLGRKDVSSERDG